MSRSNPQTQAFYTAAQALFDYVDELRTYYAEEATPGVDAGAATLQRGITLLAEFRRTQAAAQEAWATGMESSDQETLRAFMSQYTQALAEYAELTSSSTTAAEQQQKERAKLLDRAREEHLN